MTPTRARFTVLRFTLALAVVTYLDRVAISSAAKPLDPVLEEFGFRPGRRRIGGGSFGIAARTLPQLDPSGALGQRWRRYRGAFERLSALAAADG
jgi:hypothetical protein